MSPQYSGPKFCRLPLSGIYWLIPEAPHPARLGCGEATIDSMGLDLLEFPGKQELGGGSAVWAGL